MISQETNQNIYYDHDCRVVAQKILKSYFQEHADIVATSFAELGPGNAKLFRWNVLETARLIRDTGIAVQSFTCYNTHKVYFFMGDKPMRSCLTIEIPYGAREQYVEVAYRINQLVDINGMVMLAVNNNPYEFKAYLVIETHENFEQIKDIVKNHSLTTTTVKGIDEILGEHGYRKWNTISFHNRHGREEFSALYQSRFLFASRDDLEMRIPTTTVNICRPKIFISYSHKDAALVNVVVGAMMDSGINTWIDKIAIDYGDDIIDRVHSAMQECSLAVIFLSNNTKDALFAKHELKTLYSQVIYGRGAWFPVKIDDVKINEIIEGLENYLYYDYSKNTRLPELIDEIKKKSIKTKLVFLLGARNFAGP